MSESMAGRRLYANEDGKFGWMQPGDYYFDGYVWVIRDPNGKLGSIGEHTVTEHEDGTITVSPSILDDAPGGWHGFLERGVWREA